MERIKELKNEVLNEYELRLLIDRTQKEIIETKKEYEKLKKEYDYLRYKLRHLKEKLRLKEFNFTLDRQTLINIDRLKYDKEYREMKNIWKGL